MEKKLTAKQRRFVEEYLVDLNATQAAKRAGYSERTAAEAGYENLRKPHLAEMIQKKLDERSKGTGITAEYVLKSLRSLAAKCLQEEDILVDGVKERGKLDPAGANRALELLGKNLKLFTDVVRVEEEPEDPMEKLAKYGALCRKYGLEPENL